MAYINIHEGFTDKTTDRSHHIKNPLHQFASYNAIFTLSGVKEEELNNQSFLTNPVHDIIARSGGIGDGNTQASDGLQIGNFEEQRTKANKYDNERYETESLGLEASRNILNRNHDIFIEDVNMLSTIGPNTQRNMASVTKMDFRIHEPYSITFIEKVRAATLLNGFLDYQDAPLLLTIDFVGTDENGNKVKAYGLQRKIPILIVRVEFEVNEGGAVYDIIAVPLNEMAFDDRFKMARTDISIEPSNPDDFAEKVNEVIKKDQEKEIEQGLRQYEDTYKFTVHPDLKKQIKLFYALPGVHTQGSVQTWLERSNNVSGGIQRVNDPTLTDGGGAFSYLPEDNSGASTGSGIETEIPRGSSLPEAFSDYIRTLPPYRDFATDFWKAYYTMTGTITDFAIDDGIFNTAFYTKNRRENNKKIAKLQADPKKQDELYKTYQENQYIPWYRIKSSVRTNYKKFDRLTQMHPKEIHYEAVPYKVHILKLLKPGVSLGKVNWDDFVRKSYNYIYTGDNVDINALRINYKSAYYMRAVRPEVKTGTESGELNPLDKAFAFLYPNEKQPERLLPLRQYPSVIKGRSATEGIPSVAQEFFDYLTNPVADMMNIQIDILGDPGYLTQDNFVPINDRRSEINPVDEFAPDKTFDEEWNTTFNSFNSDRYQPIINLKYRLPADVNERKGFMFSRESKSIDENLFFSGAYQVYKVDSRFERGAFTQTLHCVRLNNQQGTGVPGVLFTSANKLTEIKTDRIFDKGLDGLGLGDYTNISESVSTSNRGNEKEIPKNTGINWSRLGKK